MLSKSELVNKIVIYNKKTNKELVAKAYDFCVSKHAGQVRKSGEPYHTHPIAVAEELVKIKLDDVSIIGALLHDVIEDTDTTKEIIEAEFSQEIAEVVDGVTKLDKINFSTDRVKQAENFRKLFIAMSKDVRVLIIKLYDRLHNMQTISFQPDIKRKSVAIETLEIYAPLAERIGLQKAKNELQNMSFAIINKNASDSIIKRLNRFKQKRDSRRLIKSIISEVEALLAEYNIKARICGRVKTPYSIWLKMVNKHVPFDQIMDIIAFRIITETVEDCYRVVCALHLKYRAIPGKFMDYISTPKSNNYMSIHTAVMGLQHNKTEIQIRTKKMHEENEYGFAAHWRYKQKIDGKNMLEKQNRWINRVLSIIEKSTTADELLSAAKIEINEDQIFVFTSKGDIIDMPNGATALDFAFAIDVELGTSFDYANINGDKMPAQTVLNNGDQINIITSKLSHPKLSWLKKVITGDAINQIKKIANKEELEKKRIFGHKILMKALHKYGRSTTEKELKKIAKFLNLNSISSLYMDIYDHKIDIIAELHKIYPQTYIGGETSSDEQANGIQKMSFAGRSNNLSCIANVDNKITKHLASCCKPEFGDSIVGIVVQNIGVIIHKTSCCAIKNLHLTPSEFVELGWN